MTIIEDTRNRQKKHELKHRYFERHGIKVVRSKLPVGDYALLTNLSVIIDTKASIQEIIGNVTKDHERFRKECDFAKENGIKLIVLIEDDKVTCANDLFGWYNARLKKSPKAITGKTLAKILMSLEKRHGVKFEFCHKQEAGRRIIEILGGNENEQRNIIQRQAH